MDKNQTIHNFDTVIGTKPNRSKFERSYKHTTTLNAGDLIPLHVDEILPGDSINMDTKALVRQTTMIKPVMDNAYMDIMTFFVPMRIVWDDTEKFFGANEDPWAQLEDVRIPKVKAPTTGWLPGTIADYMGISNLVHGKEVNALPFRAYAKIVNDWYRDQNLQSVAHITKTTTTIDGDNGKNYVTDLEKGGYPFKANKYKDYFTSGLPGQQKGAPITVNVGGQAPVTGKISSGYDETGFPLDNLLGVTDFIPSEGTLSYAASITTSDKKKGFIVSGTTPGNKSIIDFENKGELVADLSTATGISINDLREAIAMQQYLELDARSGTRYVEYLQAHFGVTNGDERLQRSEYLGGTHKPLGVTQIPQTSGNTDTTPQANLAALGQTGIFGEERINKTFTEHGYLISVGVVRYYHTYQQGLEKMWTRDNKFDIFDPLFQGLGEQAILNEEIYATGTATDNEIFAFQERYAEYRYKANRTSGLMRSMPKEIGASLDIWHYGDNYAELPKLSQEWLAENQTNIDRTLAIKSTGENAQPQFQLDLWIENIMERPMAVFSTPGLLKL